MSLDRVFYILTLLENSDLTSREIDFQLSEKFDDCSLRTTQRLVNELCSRISITQRKNIYQLDKDENYLSALSSLFTEAANSNSGWRSLIHGEPTREAFNYQFHNHRKPATFLYNLIEAILSSREIQFYYSPQTEYNLKAARNLPRKINAPPDTINVTTLPIALIFGGPHISVFAQTDIKGIAGARQYELIGIPEFTPGQMQSRIITDSPADVYKNSVYIWFGGTEYNITLEFSDPGGRAIARSEKTVNGEDEILSYVASSLGRIRIVNPPDQISQRADQIGLNRQLIFSED